MADLSTGQIIRFQRGLLSVLGIAARRRVRPRINSTTLRRSLFDNIVSDTQLEVTIPHFWAVFVHDGRRGGFTPTNSRFFVWYRNPRSDPRFSGTNLPERLEDLRRLTETEFRAAQQMQRDDLEAGREPRVVITSAIRRATTPNPFFSVEPGGGMAGFVKTANREGQFAFRRFFQQQFATPSLLGPQSLGKQVRKGSPLDYGQQRITLRINL